MNREIVFKSSARKIITMLIISAAFTAAGVDISTANPVIGWSCVVLSGFACLILIVMLFPKGLYLRLTPNEIEYCSPMKRIRIKWADVVSIRIGSIRSSYFVSVTYAPRELKNKWYQDTKDLEIGNYLDGSLEEILEALNTSREIYNDLQNNNMVKVIP